MNEYPWSEPGFAFFSCIVVPILVGFLGFIFASVM